MGDAFSHTEAHKRELDNFRVFLRLRGVTGQEVLDEKKKEKSKNADRQKKISAAITDKYRAFCGNPKAQLPRKRLSQGTLLVRGLPSDLEAKLVTGVQSAGTHDLLRLESLIDQVEFYVPSESVGTQDVVDVSANIPTGNVQQDGLVISSCLETAKDSSEILSDLLAGDGSILEETGGYHV
ncbi:uncharacterized protein LOC135493779 isoform X1 [Lineus longissimus]|uniref:uncharacterized protein LOC135493779 isoform X1 n=1 Tax=Lineus longissimus TaxID=88925 RepID=UPI00315D7952